jgi:hypothetical protein
MKRLSVGSGDVTATLPTETTDIPAVVRSLNPPSQLSVEVDPKALRLLAHERAKKSQHKGGGVSQVDLQLAAGGDGLHLVADGRNVAAITLSGPGVEEEIAAFIQAFESAPPEKLAGFGGAISQDLAAILDALPRTEGTLTTTERRRIDEIAGSFGQLTLLATVAAAAVAYYAAGTAILGDLLQSLVFGTLMWPVSVPALLIALVAGAFTGKLGAKMMGDLLTRSSSVMAEAREADGAASKGMARLESLLQKLGFEIRQSAATPQAQG